MNRAEFAEILDNCPDISRKQIVLWGTGNTAELYQEGLNRLTESKGLSFLGYGDNNAEKLGTLFHGKKVFSAGEIAGWKDAVVLIVSPQKRVSDAVGAQLDSYGIEHFLLDEIIFKSHKKELLEAYDILEDDRSKEVYSTIALLRMTNGTPGESIFTENQYFCLPEFKRHDPNEVFVECGGYVGDTLEQYLWQRGGRFKKIISFEPDKANFSAMEHRLDRLMKEWNLSSDDVSIFPYGISDRDSIVSVNSYINNHGLGSRIGEADTEEGSAEGIEKTRLIAIDEFLDEPVSFLKADIESYEYKMIIGAQRAIAENRPIMAVCIYHNAIDFFQIPLLIHKLVPEYRLAVRHHSYSLDETVLYAY